MVFLWASSCLQLSPFLFKPIGRISVLYSVHRFICSSYLVCWITQSIVFCSPYFFFLPWMYYVLFWPCLITFSALFTVHLFIIHNPTYTWFSHGYSSCVVSCFVYSFPAATYQYKRLFFLLDSYLGYLQVILICISNFVQKGNFIQETVICVKFTT